MNMKTITKPMLAGKCEPSGLKYPILCTPKLDGIRCVKVAGRALTRTFHPVSNEFTRDWIEENLPDGVDGELMLRGGTCNETMGAIGRHRGEPDFVFNVFDYAPDTDVPYDGRMRALDAAVADGPHVRKILPVEVRNEVQLAEFEEECLREGYEGVMIRDPRGPYKCGRSTTREGLLLKLKRFEDDEAVVIGSVEGTSNQNAAEKDAFGRTKRSSAKAGKVGRGTLGALIVRDLKTGVEFRVGFKDGELADGLCRDRLPGRIITYRHQPSGRVNAPRFPKFVKFRESWDCEISQYADSVRAVELMAR